MTCCNLSIDAHLRQFSICRSIKSESELLKIRGGFFSEDDEILTICSKHRYVLGVDGGQVGCVPLDGHVIIKARAIQKEP